VAILDLSIPTLYRMVAAGKFPRPLPIDGASPRQGKFNRPRQKWSANEVQAWIVEQRTQRDLQQSA